MAKEKNMKKLCVFLMCLCPLFAFAGCGQVDTINLLKNNLSEVSDVYYFSQDPVLKVSICSGKREEPYIYDGKSCDKLDFALITADIEGSDSEMVTISINGVAEDVILEFNYKTGTHMADLGRKLSGSEKIEFKYLDQTTTLECKSNSFVVSSDDAILLGYQTLQNQIDSLVQDGEFKGEAYLKIIDSLSGGFEDVFWLFSILDQNGEMKNLIISTQEGIVLADGNQNMI